MNDIDNIDSIDNVVKTLRSVADYLIAVHATAQELRGHGVGTGVDLDGCLDRAEELQNAATELVVARAQRQALVIVSNPPYPRPIS